MSTIISEIPEIMKLWSNKNTLNPKKLTIGSNKRALWTCIKNHEWEATIANIALRGRRCPYCSNKKIIPGYNDLFTLNTEAEKYWSKNNTIEPTSLAKGSTKRALWTCELGHEWESIINNFTKGYRCPYCSNKKILKGFNDLATIRPDLIKWWSSNNEITPYEISVFSNKKILWMCKLEHEWEEKCSNIAVSNKRRCPYCSGHRVFKNFNNIGFTHPLLNQYCVNKNVLDEYSKGSQTILEWNCPKYNINYKRTICEMIRVYPFCACPNCTKNTSSFELEVNQFIKEILKIKTITSNRQIIKPYELDIVIKSKKIAIECNGNYWHSDEVIQKSKNMSAKEYHSMKKDLSKESGYDLFFIWESDWKTNRETVEQELIKIFNNNFNNIALLNRLE